MDTPQAPRLGPRPLPLHLAAAITSFASSQAALPLLKSGFLAWRPELRQAGGDLEESLAAVGLEALAEAVDRELRSRADRFLRGIERYRHHAYRRDLGDPATLWQDGS